jgi:hypothetical protein
VNFEENPESGYKAITSAAFSIRENDADYEAKLRFGILMSLPGVGIGGRLGNPSLVRSPQILRN